MSSILLGLHATAGAPAQQAVLDLSPDWAAGGETECVLKFAHCLKAHSLSGRKDCEAGFDGCSKRVADMQAKELAVAAKENLEAKVSAHERSSALHYVASQGPTKIAYFMQDPVATSLMEDDSIAGLEQGHICKAYGAPDCLFQKLRMTAEDLPTEAQLKEAQSADILVVPSTLLHAWDKANMTGHNSKILPRRGGQQTQTRVLYWRDGSRPAPSAEAQGEFDMLMGHQINAAIINPIPFAGARALFGERAEAAAERITTPLNERRGNAIAIIHGRCDADSLRDQYLEELQQHMKIDIYGCGLQKPSDHKFGELPKGEAELLAFVAQYKFYLAFEETISPGYATSQLLSVPLIAGAIPVHLGAPEVEKLPAPDGTNKPWYVSVLKHESPKQLALELRALMADEKKLAAMVEWREGLDLESTMWGTHNGPVSQAIADLAWDTDVQQPSDFRAKPSPKQQQQQQQQQQKQQQQQQQQKQGEQKGEQASLKSLKPAHSEEMVDVTAHRRAVCSLCDHARMAKLKSSHPFKPLKPQLTRQEAAAKLGLPAEAARVRRKVNDDQ